MRIKDRRVSCQHCYERVMLVTSDDPGAESVLRDARGMRECVPGPVPVLHKPMPGVEPRG